MQEFLTKFKTLKNCVLACNQEGMYKALEAQQGELEICEKALAEFKESKRRAFPRFYFVSSNDLLDILSNGARALCTWVLHARHLRDLKHSQHTTNLRLYCILVQLFLCMRIYIQFVPGLPVI